MSKPNNPLEIYSEVSYITKPEHNSKKLRKKPWILAILTWQLVLSHFATNQEIWVLILPYAKKTSWMNMGQSYSFRKKGRKQGIDFCNLAKKTAGTNSGSCQSLYWYEGMCACMHKCTHTNPPAYSSMYSISFLYIFFTLRWYFIIALDRIGKHLSTKLGIKNINKLVVWTILDPKQSENSDNEVCMYVRDITINRTSSEVNTYALSREHFKS